MPFSLACVICGIFILLLVLVWLLNIFGLPANWIILGMTGCWQLFWPDSASLGILYWISVLGLVILGEILEFFLKLKKAKKHGSSSTGAFGGLIGAIIGSILLAPFLFGLGAFFGALAGAWVGCLLVELLKGRGRVDALNAAWGCMMGQFLGTVCKMGLGAAMIVITAHCIWPEPSEIPETKAEIPLSLAHFRLTHGISGISESWRHASA